MVVIQSHIYLLLILALLMFHMRFSIMQLFAMDLRLVLIVDLKRMELVRINMLLMSWSPIILHTMISIMRGLFLLASDSLKIYMFLKGYYECWIQDKKPQSKKYIANSTFYKIWWIFIEPIIQNHLELWTTCYCLPLSIGLDVNMLREFAQKRRTLPIVIS